MLLLHWTSNCLPLQKPVAVPYTIPYLDNLKFNVGTIYYAVDAIEDTNEFYLKGGVRHAAQSDVDHILG